MSVAATKNRTQDYFDVTLEDAAPFKASLTVLRSSESPNRGKTWVVEAIENIDGVRARILLIVFPKTLANGDHDVIGEDKKDAVTIELVDYMDPSHPTSKLAVDGTITLNLDLANSRFTGEFDVQIEKFRNSSTSTSAEGKFDTSLTIS